MSDGALTWVLIFVAIVALAAALGLRGVYLLILFLTALFVLAFVVLSGPVAV